MTTNVLNDTSNYDFLKSLSENESLTNIDLSENDGFDQQMKFKLSLIMMRNIERLRQLGVMVQGNWFNKNVLMFKETIETQKAKALSQVKEGSEAR